jgi:hypothetical protein
MRRDDAQGGLSDKSAAASGRMRKDEPAMSWSRNAILLAFAAAIVAGLVSFEPPAQPQPGAMSTVACYVALANDLTPLLDSDAPDPAWASPECAVPPIEEGSHRDVHVVASGIDTAKPAKTTPSRGDGTLSSDLPYAPTTEPPRSTR